MPQPIIAANWKMHGTSTRLQAWCEKLTAQPLPEGVDVLFFPPTIFLPDTQRLLQQSQLRWGGQTASEHSQGAFTGEVSTDMLTEFGCRYVLAGHSERRKHYGETNTLVAAKVAAIAANSELTPLLCVGETQEEHASGQTEAVLQAQIQAVLTFAPGLIQRCVIAYEPVWAIGTGLAATPEQAQTTHISLRRIIAKTDPAFADKLSILYGGSVKPNNIQNLLAMPDIDGVLVGGASLDPASFLSMIQLAGEKQPCKPS